MAIFHHFLKVDYDISVISLTLIYFFTSKYLHYFSRSITLRCLAAESRKLKTEKWKKLNLSAFIKKSFESNRNDSAKWIIIVKKLWKLENGEKSEQEKCVNCEDSLLLKFWLDLTLFARQKKPLSICMLRSLAKESKCNGWIYSGLVSLNP